MYILRLAPSGLSCVCVAGLDTQDTVVGDFWSLLFLDFFFLISLGWPMGGGECARSREKSCLPVVMGYSS